MRKSAYKKVTERIIALMEQGVVPWHKPWQRGPERGPQNPFTGTVYSGINELMLAGTMMGEGWSDPRFTTFKQVKANGGHVLKGSIGTPVLIWVPVFDELDDGERVVKALRPKAYTVFNIATQTEGIELEPLPTHQPVPHDDLVARYTDAPPLQHGHGFAAYSPKADVIYMPHPDQFDTPIHYRSTLYHEMIHSTGAKKRIAREGIVNFDQFGSQKYSFEELIAELGAAMLCSEAGIERHIIDNSASYIAGWMSKIRDDHSLIIKAAREAEKAVKYMLGEGAQSADETPIEDEEAAAA